MKSAQSLFPKSLSLLFCLLSSCATTTQSGALGGGLAGAGIGAVAGGGKGALIGGAAGIIGGAIIGSALENNSHKRKNFTLGTLVRWKDQGVSEKEIEQRLLRSHARFKGLNKEQIDYLKAQGFSNDFINWYQAHTEITD